MVLDGTIAPFEQFRGIALSQWIFGNALIGEWVVKIGNG
jgi:hypothetical protein